jgi:hypothetical protein
MAKERTMHDDNEFFGPRQYSEMEAAFRPHGGIVGCDGVIELLHKRTDQPISRLARWIVDREVLSVHWQSRMMVPLFQFDRASMLPRSPVREVIWELAPVLDDWLLALWFARPNVLLGDDAPVDAIEANERAVVDAARVERFLLRG